MSRQPYNQTWKNQQQKLVRATYKRGTIVSVNDYNGTANVSFIENPQTIVKNIPFALNISISFPGLEVFVGANCRVDLYNEASIANSMVISSVF